MIYLHIYFDLLLDFVFGKRTFSVPPHAFSGLENALLVEHALIVSQPTFVVENARFILSMKRAFSTKEELEKGGTRKEKANILTEH